MKSRCAALLALSSVGLVSAALPSCESDTEAHCLGESADLSPEGIDTCLRALDSSVRSEGCSTFLSVISGCDADISTGGVCNDAHMNGETMACLMQRVAPDKLSEACAAALPKAEAVTGLKKLWADGKRILTDEEAKTLKGEDKDDYKRWLKRKKAPKSGKDQERDFAVRAQKKERAFKTIKEKAVEAAYKAVAAGDGGMALMEASKAAREAADQEIAEDMTGTLSKSSFTKSKLTDIAKEAIKEAKAKHKAEL